METRKQDKYIKRRPLGIEGRNLDDEERRKTIQGTTTTQEAAKEAEVEQDRGEDRKPSGGVSMRWGNREDLENGIREGQKGGVANQGVTSDGEAFCEHYNQIEKEERKWGRSRKETNHDEDERERNEEKTNTEKMDTEKQEEMDE